MKSNLRLIKHQSRRSYCPTFYSQGSKYQRNNLLNKNKGLKAISNKLYCLNYIHAKTCLHAVHELSQDEKRYRSSTYEERSFLNCVCVRIIEEFYLFMKISGSFHNQLKNHPICDQNICFKRQQLIYKLIDIKFLHSHNVNRKFL